MDCCFNFNNGKKRIQWDITYKCNLNCIHCCAPKQDSMFFEVDQNIENALAFIKKYNVEKVSLSGGEATQNKKFAHIVKQLSIMNCSIGLISNLFYPYQTIENVVNYIDTITTSIDGPELIHNMIRGKQCYHQTMSNLHKLIEQKKKCKVITTINAINYPYIEDTIAALAQNGVDDIMCAKISAQGLGKVNYKFLKVNISDKEILCVLDKLSKKYNVKINLSRCAFLDSGMASCDAGKSICNISALGYIYPCHLKTIGNLHLNNLNITPEYVDTFPFV